MEGVDAYLVFFVTHIQNTVYQMDICLYGVKTQVQGIKERPGMPLIIVRKGLVQDGSLIFFPPHVYLLEHLKYTMRARARILVKGIADFIFCQ
jgi:hypothetical protein